MTITISWEAVIAICAAMTILAGAGVFVVKSVVRDELRKQDGRYLLSAGSTLTGAEIGRRLKHLEAME